MSSRRANHPIQSHAATPAQAPVGTHTQALLHSTTIHNDVLQASRRVEHAPQRTHVCLAAAATPDQLDQLQVEETTLPGCLVHLKVSVPPSTCQRHYDSVLKELQQQVTLPGFRKTSSKKGGSKKAKGTNSTSMSMLINAAGGQQAVNANAIERLLHEALPQVLLCGCVFHSTD